MVKLKEKGGFEMSFGVMFALIAGAAILFLAIYGTTRLFTTAKTFTDTEAAAKLSAYLNPIVNGITSAYATKIEFKQDTRVYIACKQSTGKSPYFGAELISFSQSSGIIEKWSPPGFNISKYNKYIFAEEMLEGKTLYVFSKPYTAGFRVDDIVVLTMNNYCFFNPPENIKREIETLKMENINVSASVKLCSKDSVKVCFGSAGSSCNVSVFSTCTPGSSSQYCENEYDIGYVTKDGKQMEYYGSLMYGAIFSSPETYECNIARLGNKIAALAEVYKGKAEIVKTKNCNTIIGNDLTQIITIASGINSSAELSDLYKDVWEMDIKNCESDCEIYPKTDCSLYS